MQQRRKFTAVLVSVSGGLSFGLLWGAGLARAAGLTESDAAMGIRAALERGAVSAVGLLGRTGGFLDNPKVRIPLPGFLNDAAQFLKLAGQQQKVDELVTAMNRAAASSPPSR